MQVFELPRMAEKLPAREKKLWQRIYTVDVLEGKLELVSEMRSWVEKKFGSTSEVENQKIVRVTNLVTGEGALFNNLRSKRPVTRFSEQELDALVEEHRRGCPFCIPEERTPGDSFGRIRGKYCITAANLTKYDGYHSLIIPREHHPLRFNEDMVEDYFRVAARWFREVQACAASKGGHDTTFYPFLMWNCLWPAGSSVVHGHLQLTVTPQRHYSKVEQLRQCSLEYARHYGNNYFHDLYNLYKALELGWAEGETGLMSILTPVKEKEVWILLPPGRATLDKLGLVGRAVCRVLNRLQQQAGLQSFNVAVYLPPLAGEAVTAGWQGFPVMARLVDRGNVFNRTADFGAMELFATGVISSDPFAVAGFIRSRQHVHRKNL
ncbi:hypothetical protein [Desulfallas thermosapovorans]|uniref:Galactose-1-phosphate uridylyltransferase n=1 Tax=Desulfallas thermosapovorans DSM 6562 TaxID=1121431 RepID=A0A5S4ZVH5_9FIRM|nr:hypothetical protein [Desulfallas thermosapovorans]TYO96922.1 hypothetical protein LX24_00732 [Desulfallas thermosapovorans DSM 6562]